MCEFTRLIEMHGSLLLEYVPCVGDNSGMRWQSFDVEPAVVGHIPSADADKVDTSDAVLEERDTVQDDLVAESASRRVVGFPG
jgi:hypothetical protein